MSENIENPELAWSFAKMFMKDFPRALFLHIVAAIVCKIGLLTHNTKLQRKGVALFRAKAQPLYRKARMEVIIADTFDKPEQRMNPRFFDLIDRVCEL